MKKLKIISACDQEERVVDIEEAKNWNFFDPTALVVVEKQLIYSYEDLLEIAASDELKDKETLDVHLMITCTGG